jgi:hypothetical protein
VFPIFPDVIDKLVDNPFLLVVSCAYYSTKLFESAQGMQYLHSLSIVHGDLRCVSVQLVGNSCLSSIEDIASVEHTHRPWPSCKNRRFRSFVDISKRGHHSDNKQWFLPMECSGAAYAARSSPNARKRRICLRVHMY